MKVRNLFGMTLVAVVMATAAYAAPPAKHPWIHVSDWLEGVHDAQEQELMLTCNAIVGHLEDHFYRDAIEANFNTAVECGIID